MTVMQKREDVGGNTEWTNHGSCRCSVQFHFWGDARQTMV